MFFFQALAEYRVAVAQEAERTPSPPVPENVIRTITPFPSRYVVRDPIPMKSTPVAAA